MIYVKWVLMVPVMLLLTALAFPLAPFLPLFAEPRQGRLSNNTEYGEGWYLPNWLGWFQTPDNSLDGDNGWQTEHMQWRFKFPAAIAIYLGRVGWLWRNPAYGFGVVYLESGAPIVATYSGEKDVNDDPGLEGWCLVHAADLFQFSYVKKIADNKSIYCVFGWNINGLIDEPRARYAASFAFSPRLSKFKE